MTAQEQHLTRVAWDKIAPGYDKTIPRRRCGWAMKVSAVPDFFRACGSLMWRPAAVPSASPRRG